MSLQLKTPLVFALLMSIAACDESSSVADGTEPDGGGTGGGPVVNTNLVALTNGNSRELSEYSAQRLNMVTAEVFRTLRRLYRDPMDNPVDLNMRMADSNNAGLPVDPFDPGFCVEDGAEVVRFSDFDASDTLTAGDEILFSYNVLNCTLSSSSDYGPSPSAISGVIRFIFNADTVVGDPLRLAGTASFENYGYQNGVLAYITGESDTIPSGVVDFDITFNNADSTAVFISTNGVQLGSSTSDLTLPVNLSFTRVERNLTGGTTTLFLDNVVVSSDVSEARVVMSTMAYPDPNPDGDASDNTDQILTSGTDAYPHLGALLLVGNNSSVFIASQPLGGAAQTDNSGLVPTEVDADGDGLYETLNPSSWDFLLAQFLIPGTNIPPTP